MTTIAKPPEYRWVRDDIPFGDSTVELWCPQTQDFESHGPGTLERKGGIDKEELEKFTAFKNWKENMLYNLKWQDISEFHPYHKRPYSLKSLHINAVSFFFQVSPLFFHISLTFIFEYWQIWFPEQLS